VGRSWASLPASARQHLPVDPTAPQGGPGTGLHHAEGPEDPEAGHGLAHYWFENHTIRAPGELVAEVLLVAVAIAQVHELDRRVFGQGRIRLETPVTGARPGD
jgi:hypothetical protein